MGIYYNPIIIVDVNLNKNIAVPDLTCKSALLSLWSKSVTIYVLQTLCLAGFLFVRGSNEYIETLYISQVSQRIFDFFFLSKQAKQRIQFLFLFLFLFLFCWLSPCVDLATCASFAWGFAGLALIFRTY
jgi:hypothetical protein